MKWGPGMQFTRENRVSMRMALLKGVVRCLAAPRQIVWPLREHTRVRQYLPAVTAIKISALLPGALLASKSGERLDRPQPGLT